MIDHELLQSKLYLILCGSQINFIENDVLGYKNPLSGRRTTQFKIEGFDYYDAAKRLVLGQMRIKLGRTSYNTHLNCDIYFTIF